MPATVIVPVSDRLDELVLDLHVSEELVEQVHHAAQEVGGYPIFLRTDQASGKHGWEKTCFVPDADSLPEHIRAVVEENILAGILGLQFTALVVREFLELDTRFTAFRGHMPIARERRYFVREGHVECHHAYWVERAVWRGMYASGIPESTWRPLLADLNRETPDEVQVLTEYAECAGQALGGYWSVDFAMTRKGVWYLIDMARGEVSYHPEECPYSQE